MQGETDKSAPIVALYWLLKRLLTYWFISDVLPTLEDAKRKPPSQTEGKRRGMSRMRQASRKIEGGRSEREGIQSLEVVMGSVAIPPPLASPLPPPMAVDQR